MKGEWGRRCGLPVGLARRSVRSRKPGSEGGVGPAASACREALALTPSPRPSANAPLSASFCPFSGSLSCIAPGTSVRVAPPGSGATTPFTGAATAGGGVAADRAAPRSPERGKKKKYAAPERASTTNATAATSAGADALRRRWRKGWSGVPAAGAASPFSRASRSADSRWAFLSASETRLIGVFLRARRRRAGRGGRSTARRPRRSRPVARCRRRR